MLKKKQTVLWLFVLFINSCSDSSSQVRESEMKRIIEFMVPKLISSYHRYTDRNIVIVMDSTIRLKESMRSLEKARNLIGNDPKVNKTSMELVKGLYESDQESFFVDLNYFNFNSEFQFVSSSTWEGDFKNALGVIVFSDVYFNSSQDLGLFYYFWNCPGDCGGDFFVFIKKENGQWIIHNRVSLSVS